MEIGGKDLTIKHNCSNPMDVVAKVINHNWENPIYDFDYLESSELRNSVFIFQNYEAELSWQKYGRTDDNADKMIWLIYEPPFGPGEIHCVFEGGKESLEIIKAIEKCLNP